MLSAIAAISLVAASLAVGTATASQALSGSSFQPGNIISDANFYDANGMTEAQIQVFLESKEGACGNTNCLRLKRTDTITRSADPMCAAYTGAAAELASTILFKVQQACGISAKVLLVTLQKEQNLVSATSPSDGTLERAMGYGCPDDPANTGHCDPAYAGFYNQVYRAAWQLKRYGNPPGTSNFFNWLPVGGTPNILYQANNPGCGSPSVLIQNKATAALYYYTPYQPNAAALANLNGNGDSCSAYGNRNFWVFYTNWFGSPTGPSLSPIGNFELASTTLTTATFRGWAFDPETAAPIDVHLYVNNVWGGAFTASTPRADIAAAYPSYGAAHGFEFTVPVGPGTFQACIYGINVGEGSNQLIGCRSVSTPSGPPFGNFEAASTSGGLAAVTGWAVDPDAATAIGVDFYVNGVFAGHTTADGDRSDIAVAYPGYGSNHGFTASVPVVGGINQICAYGINIGGGVNQPLGCKTVTAPSGPPLGNFEAASAVGGVATLVGWVIDPDVPTASLAVHVYVNGMWGGAYSADAIRDDVAAVYPGYGSKHGYQLSVAVPGGSSQVCAYGINVGPGFNQLLGCKTVNQ